MCIYFIQAEQGGLIKIGYSNSPITRLYTIQLCCPIKLRILSTIKDEPQSREYWIHQDLQKWNCYGEWFEPSSEVLSFMNKIAVPFDEAQYLPKIEPSQIEETTERYGKLFKRCRGFSTTNNKQCRSTALYGDYCIIHKP